MFENRLLYWSTAAGSVGRWTRVFISLLHIMNPRQWVSSGLYGHGGLTQSKKEVHRSEQVLLGLYLVSTFTKAVSQIKLPCNHVLTYKICSCDESGSGLTQTHSQGKIPCWDKKHQRQKDSNSSVSEAQWVSVSVMLNRGCQLNDGELPSESNLTHFYSDVHSVMTRINLLNPHITVVSQQGDIQLQTKQSDSMCSLWGGSYRVRKLTFL